MLGCINEQQPDIILFGGDIVDDKLPNDNAIKEIDGKDYSDMGPFYNGYATVTLKSNAHKSVVDNNGKLIFEDKEGK